MEFVLQLDNNALLRVGDELVIDDDVNIGLTTKITRMSLRLKTVFVEITNGDYAGSDATIPLSLFNGAAEIIELPDNPNDPNFVFQNRGNS